MYFKVGCFYFNPTYYRGGGCILTGGAMKLILYDFSSKFIPEIWVEKLFSSGKKFGHTGLFVGGHRQIPLITEIWNLKKF